MYQSIHTTVYGPGDAGTRCRSAPGRCIAPPSSGIAAHWRYKAEGRESGVDDALTWFRQVLEWQKDASEPEEFMEFLRMDLFQGEIFVFTPKAK